MPRPPRAKVASRVAKPTNTKPTARKPSTRNLAAQKEQIRDAVNDDSEESDFIVVKQKSTRLRKKIPEETMSETIQIEEVATVDSTATPPSAQKNVSAARTPLATATKQTTETRSSDRSSAKRTGAAASSASRRSSRRSVPGEASAIEDSSGFDLTLSSLDSNSPAHGTRPPSAIKVGATPAHERSILALTNFKRRARQPSLLRMVQQTTDVEDNDEHSGLDNTDNFDFDDFLPQAESTPLNLRKGLPEDDTRNDSGTHISSSGSRGTKRKLSPVVQVPRSSPPFSPPSGADLDSVRSPSPSLPEIIPSREEVIEQTQEDSDVLSETYASPKSSSPVRAAITPQQSPVQQRIRRRGRLAKTPVDDTDSEGEETETPAKIRRKAKQKAQPQLNTAHLKGLLPRRRNRMRDRDEFDIDDSEEVTQLDSDQDELQMPTQQIRARPGTSKLVSPKAAKKTARGKKTLPAKSTQKASRTYSRRISSDKENDAEQPQEEDNEVSAIEQSERLAAIRKKFEEVDAFELEFEEVEVVTSSSPFR